MMTTCRCLVTLMIVFFSLNIVFAQQESPTSPQSPVPTVTATASTDRVRYLAAGEVHHTRLQVFSAQGGQVFDSSFRLGNLIDWQLVDQQGTALSDGTYLFLVTVRDFSGNLSQKYGTAILEQGQVYLEQTQRAELPASLSTALESNQQADTLAVIDRIGAAGLNRTASTASNDGTAVSPASTSGTTETDATGGDKELGGTGTQNQIAKWIDDAGNLGDSIITESGGNIGIGTSSPSQKLHVATGNLLIGNGTSSHSLLLDYVGTGGGGDITARMGGVEMLSFGFNSTGTLGGTPSTTSGRLLYFYDRVAAQYRGGFNSVGEWYWGPTTSRYGLKVAQPNVGVTGVTVDAAGNVGIGTTTLGSKLTVSSDFVPTPTLSVFNTGTGGAGTGNAGNFQIMNSSNLASALIAATNGGGNAVQGSTSGSGTGSAVRGFNNGAGRAAHFEIGQNGNSSNALEARTNGTGRAGYLEIIQSGNSSYALEARTNGTGRAGQFQILNPNNIDVALVALTNGSGDAVAGQNTGMGRAAYFNISDANNSSRGLFAQTQGTGNAALIRIFNSSNSSAALEASTNGGGFAARFIRDPITQAGTAQGIYIEATDGLKALEIKKGRVILSYGTLTGGTTEANAVSIPTDVAVFMVGNNNQAGIRATTTLPATGENGQIIIVGTNDPDGAAIYEAVVSPYNISTTGATRFVRIGGAWKVHQ